MKNIEFQRLKIFITAVFILFFCVVFENGLGATMDSWAKVLPEVSKVASVFFYNRPGYGDSDYPPPYA
jgi:pimeloyl-ACP methyl ester carboxylesterase